MPTPNETPANGQDAKPMSADVPSKEAVALFLGIESTTSELHRKGIKADGAIIELIDAHFAPLRARLDYVHKMGLRFGMMKTSDKPEPYLAHTWTEESTHTRMFREWSESIGWEDREKTLRAHIAELEKERDEYRSGFLASKMARGQLAEANRQGMKELDTLHTAANQAARALEKLDGIYRSELDEPPPRPQWLVDAFDALRAAGVSGDSLTAPTEGPTQ